MILIDFNFVSSYLSSEKTSPYQFFRLHSLDQSHFYEQPHLFYFKFHTKKKQETQ